ncbi:MAG: WS/DGAT domain-containing protein, partial [Pseudomonadales bacterium]
EGLEGGRTAFVLKIHHALADGMASIHLFTRLITEAFDASPPVWDPPPLPSNSQLVWQALLTHVRHDAKRFPSLVRTVIDRYKMLKLHRESSEVLAVDSLARNTQPCRFNGALTTHRKFATATHSLAHYKEVKNALGGTVNDVVLATVAGALRSYLVAHNDSIEQPLIAIIPVSADKPGVERLFGNNFTHMGTRLHIRIEDRIERFRKIQESTNAGKGELEVFGKSTLPTILNYFPPLMYTRLAQRDYVKQSARKRSYAIAGNVAVSNVPGPRQKLESKDAEMEGLYSVGPLTEGIGLNITIWSYADQLNFSIISCKKLVPDPDRIALAIDAEFIALQEVAKRSQTLSSEVEENVEGNSA